MKVDKITTILIAEKIECEGATLLSAEEAKELLTTEERKHCFYWWLRFPYNHSHYACIINHGFSYDYCRVDFMRVGVRPALIIKNHNLKIGDIFKINDYEFKVISDSLAWMHKQDIGEHCFREDWRADDANVYEQSDVKKFVDEWFEELTNEE